MTIELAPELEQRVEEQVKAGVFPSSSAAINAAVVRMFAETSPEEIAELRALVDEGLANIEAGRFIEFTGEEVAAEARRAYNARHGL